MKERGVVAMRKMKLRLLIASPVGLRAGLSSYSPRFREGSDRWNQANFNLENFQTFFQLQPGVPRRVVLLPVSSDGTVGNPEVRPSVDVKSHNFRIELGLAAGLNYPNNGRPIGIFLRIGTRRVRYRLLMPADAAYGDVKDFLTARWAGPVNRDEKDSDWTRRASPSVARPNTVIRSRLG